MATRKKAQSTTEHTHISVQISDHSVSISVGINHEIDDKRQARQNTPIYSNYASIELTGEISDPPERLGHEIMLSIQADNHNIFHFDTKLGDYHVLDENLAPIYLERRGKSIPVYDPPKSIGFIDKQRGAERWNGSAWVPPAIFSDMLTLLRGSHRLYATVHETRTGKKRAIRGITLQTSDPEDE